MYLAHHELGSIKKNNINIIKSVTVLHMQEKAAKLHEQLHGSTFHIKLAQEAMKKVRQVEAEVAAKVAAEADALKAGTDQLMLLLLLLLLLLQLYVHVAMCLHTQQLYN
jgi:hypothetical protein